MFWSSIPPLAYSLVSLIRLGRHVRAGHLLLAAALLAWAATFAGPSAAQAPAAPQFPSAETAPANSKPANSAGAPTTSATSLEELEALARTLGDDAARAKFLTDLRALIEARRAAQAPAKPEGEPPPAEKAEPIAPETLGARLIFAVSQGVRQLSEQVLSGVSLLRDLPRITDWFSAQATNRLARDFWIGLVAKLAIVLACGYAAEWIMRWLLTSPRRRIETSPATGALRRLLLGTVRAILDMLTIVAFAAATYGVMPFTDPGQRVRLVILAIVNAHIAVRVVLAVAQIVLAPTAARLRPVRVTGETAHYLYIWARRLAYVTIYGYFAVEAALLLGLSRGGHSFGLKLIGLMATGMLVMLILQNRSAVTDALRARASGQGTLSLVLGRLADVWHLLAVAYLIAAYVIWILEVREGFAFLLRATGLTLIVIAAARIVVMALDKAIERAFRVSRDLKLRYPGLESRSNRYLPALRRALRSAIYVIALLCTLQAWGAESLEWLTSREGLSIIGIVLSVVLVVALALVIWEAVNISLERYAARLDATDPTSARARTILPLVRTAVAIFMLVMVGLIVLSQIGIDITPLLAGAGVIGLAIGFGSQKLVQDVINGLFILMENTISVGDVVDLDGRGGLVEAMTIRHIRLRDFDGSLLTLPFSEVKAILNRTKDYSRYVFDIEVAYKEDVDEVMEVIRELGEEMRNDPKFGPLILEPLEVIGLDKFAASGMVIKARITTKPIQQWTVGREFNRRLKKRFDERGIEIPFPTRTIYQVKDNETLVYTKKGPHNGGDAGHEPGDPATGAGKEKEQPA